MEDRIQIKGKFFYEGERRFLVKGVAYGPYAPANGSDPFPSPEQVAEDFRKIHSLGANTVRIYHVPPAWLLDLAQKTGLRLWVDVPWPSHQCFLSSPRAQREAREKIRTAALLCARHPALLALCLGNEIPPDIVRWHGPQAVARFLDTLVEEVKSIDEECLCTYGNYPSTEYLQPQAVDFLAFNVYLHSMDRFEAYLDHLLTLSYDRPVVLSEIGFDAHRLGEARQAELLQQQIQCAFHHGAAGVVVFRYEDEWVKEGRPILDWHFGLLDRARKPRPAWTAVQQAFEHPRLSPRSQPTVSVVVAAYQAAPYLAQCLDSLLHQTYPPLEILVVDDGSTDETARIAQRFPQVRLLRHPKNRGLAAARNTGIEAAQGEWIAFLDADSWAAPEWLERLLAAVEEGDWIGAGGPNLLPPEDPPFAAVVMAAPGGPLPVLLSDTEAEHLPGCNLLIRREALKQIGGFDPVFQTAGDDVDICWRLQERGYRFRYVPAAVVWHHRRRTLAAYLRQQCGYGAAEALLEARHPAWFTPHGNSRWQGRLYQPGFPIPSLTRPMVYHGPFGMAPFQTVYTHPPPWWWYWIGSLDYYLTTVLPFLLLMLVKPGFGCLGLVGLLFPIGLAVRYASRARIPPTQRRWWSRGMLTLLYLLQPVARGWGRYRTRFQIFQTPATARQTLLAYSPHARYLTAPEQRWLVPPNIDRIQFLQSMWARLQQEGWRGRPGTPWEPIDYRIWGSAWVHLDWITAAEYDPQGHLSIRSRVQPHWTGWARWLWGGTTFLCGVLGLWLWSPWAAWLALGPIGLFAWLKYQSRTLRRQFLAALFQSAEKLQYQPLSSKELPPSSKRPPLLTRLRSFFRSRKEGPSEASSHSEGAKSKSSRMAGERP